MCEELGIKVPEWGISNSKGKCELSEIRNDTLHEALFSGASLGFAIHKGGAFGNLPLEMAHLTCRLLVALIGGKDKSYLKSSASGRQCHCLCLG